MANNDIASNKQDSETKIEFCIDLCKNLNKAYAGINRGNECFCSDSYGSNGQATSVTECDSDCEVVNQCGGMFRVSVHTVQSCDNIETTSQVTEHFKNLKVENRA